MLGGEAGIAIEDADLFPPQNVTLNGMKIYSDRSVSQIIGFANAVVQTAGSGLAPLFEEIIGTPETAEGITAIDALISDRILSTEGVLSIESYESSAQGRQYHAAATIDTIYGQTNVEVNF